MTWRRLGHVFCAGGQFDWMRSHAANPFAEHLYADRYRIYFSCRDAHNRSSVGFVEVSLRTRTIHAISDTPILSPGPLGTFDDSGVSFGCLVHDGPARYLYYMGWNLGVTVPWRNSIGLAVSRDNGPFAKQSLAPILDRNPFDPYSLSYPWVHRNADGWRMWYGSHRNWGEGTRNREHVIKHATSIDGSHWTPSDTECLPVLSDESYAYARPCVLVEQGIYKMWFSYRGRHYRLGYAESADGVRWHRMDEKGGLGPSGTGWDSEAVSYAHVFDHDGQRYAVYCGNDYGRTGFGLAVLDA